VFPRIPDFTFVFPFAAAAPFFEGRRWTPHLSRGQSADKTSGIFFPGFLVPRWSIPPPTGRTLRPAHITSRDVSARAPPPDFFFFVPCVRRRVLSSFQRPLTRGYLFFEAMRKSVHSSSRFVVFLNWEFPPGLAHPRLSLFWCISFSTPPCLFPPFHLVSPPFSLGSSSFQRDAGFLCLFFSSSYNALAHVTFLITTRVRWNFSPPHYPPLSGDEHSFEESFFL